MCEDRQVHAACQVETCHWPCEPQEGPRGRHWPLRDTSLGAWQGESGAGQRLMSLRPEQASSWEEEGVCRQQLSPWPPGPGIVPVATVILHVGIRGLERLVCSPGLRGVPTWAGTRMYFCQQTWAPAGLFGGSGSVFNSTASCCSLLAPRSCLQEADRPAQSVLPLRAWSSGLALPGSTKRYRGQRTAD